MVACALGEMHLWTSRDGKTAQTEFLALEDETLVLKRGAKEIRVPLESLSDSDQAYAKARATEAKVEKQRLQKEQAKQLESLKGLREKVPVTARRWDQWKSYYTESICGRKMLDFFEDERNIVDVPDKGVFVSTEHAVRPPDYAPSMTVYCPADYDGKGEMGVYIHISPGGGAKFQRPPVHRAFF